MSRPRVAADVYLDTNVFVYALIQGMTHSEPCRHAYERLVYEQSTVYISHLTRLEFLQAMRNLANKASLPDSFRSAFQLEQWEDAAVRQNWLKFWADKFDELIGTFEVVHELPYEAEAWGELPRIMAVGPLAAYDAFHLSTAIRYRIPEFWTTDNGFQRTTGVRVRLLHRSPVD